MKNNSNLIFTACFWNSHFSLLPCSNNMPSKLIIDRDYGLVGQAEDCFI